MNEEELCKKRLIDLSRQASCKGVVLFSDFLNLNELNIYHQCEKLFKTKTETFGGVDLAERQMAAFIPDALYYEWNYPIQILKIVPAYPKFAEKLGHRDILGSFMNLGMERSKIGDIILAEDVYYLICEDRAADYFRNHLDKIRHTAVKLEIADQMDIQIKQNLKDINGIVTSNRLDSIIACVYKFSRSQALELIRAEKVFAGGKLMLNPSYRCRPEEIISVRGHGRFVFVSENGETNKGRIKIRYQIYEN